MTSTKFYYMTQIILYMWSCDQSLVTLAILWEKISQLQFWKDLTRKTKFFVGCPWFKFNNLRLALGMTLNFPRSAEEVLKLLTNIQKFFGANSYFCWSYRKSCIALNYSCCLLCSTLIQHTCLMSCISLFTFQIIG